MATRKTNKKPAPKKPPVKKNPAPKKGPRKVVKNGLTLKQEKFCLVYMETGNASEAYRQSYNCGKMKPETINRAAKTLIDNSKINTRLLQLKEKLQETSNIKKERLLYELEAINSAKITDYVELRGGLLQFKDFDKLTDQQIRAISGVKMGKFGIELTLHGKNWTSKMIADLHGYNAPEKHEHTIAPITGVRIELDGADE